LDQRLRSFRYDAQRHLCPMMISDDGLEILALENPFRALSDGFDGADHALIVRCVLFFYPRDQWSCFWDGI
jgi:hypothetical protein